MGVRTTIALACVVPVALAGCSGTVDDGGPGPGVGGTIDEPAVVEPTTDLLDWKDDGVPVGTQVRGQDWRGLVSEDRSTADVAGMRSNLAIAAGPGRRISELLMSEGWAVVVRQDEAETRSSEVDVVDLSTGDRATLAGPRRSRPRHPHSPPTWSCAGTA